MENDKPEFLQVTKDEFDNFVNNYPRTLEWDVNGMPDPPYGTYNDFAGKTWPESIVAQVKMYDSAERYSGKPSEYFIKNNQPA